MKGVSKIPLLTREERKILPFNLRRGRELLQLNKNERSFKDVEEIILGLDSEKRMKEGNLNRVLLLAQNFKNNHYDIFDLFEAGVKGLEKGIDIIKPELWLNEKDYYPLLRSYIVEEINKFISLP